MTTVYRAIQEALERTVALKIMAPTMIADPSAAERFLKEGKTVARLNHPNIVTVYNIGRCESIYYMVMEYIEGGNLNARIRQGLTIENIFIICKQLAAALDYAHKRGYVHRDVKPENILFRADGTAVLSDFGIAKALASDTGLTPIGISIGTPEYMSPEQITGRPLDSRCDLYSLGIVLYEMLTRQKPFKGDNAMSTAMMHLHEPVPKLPRKLPFCQPLIDGLLAKNPDERFATVEQFIQNLDDTSARLRLFTKSSRSKIKTPRSATAVQSNDKKLPRTLTRLTRKIGLVTGFGVLVVVVGTAVYWKMTSYIDPQTRMISDRLPAQAERQMEGSQLTEPVGDNAYQDILKLDPRNQQALDGLKKHADRVAEKVLAKQQQEQYEEALKLVAQGLAVSPKSSGLLAIQKELTQQLEQKHRQRNVTRLLAIAKHQMSISRLIEPADDNAYASYTKVLELDPENTQAKLGLKRIAGQFEQLAQQRQREELFQESLQAIEQGLQVIPSHAGLQAVRTQVLAQIEAQARQQAEREQRQGEVERLLTQSKRQLEASQLIDPVDDNDYASYTETTRSLGEIFQDKLKSGGLGPKMLVLPAGNFMMGSTKETDGNERNDNEHQHRVTIDKPFAIGQYEVTNAEYRRFRPDKDSGRDSGLSLNGDDQPVVRVSWNDAVAYAKWLSEQTGKNYRLPTEAEWEYVARAGTTGRRYWGVNPGQACVHANFYDQTAKSALNFGWTRHECYDGYVVTSPVGQFKPNAFELYDMLGNVWEWTCSEYDENYSGGEKRCVFSGDALRSLRGGSWTNSPWNVRSAKRDWKEPSESFSTVGFRLAQDI